VQNIKLVEAISANSNDRVRMPRMAHEGARRSAIEALVRHAIETRPTIPSDI